MNKQGVDELIEEAVSSFGLDSGVNQFKNVGKELFNPKDITGKTQLSAHQINAMARVRFTTRMIRGELNPVTGKLYTIEENIMELVNDIQFMAVSHERKSRGEFVEIQKLLNTNAQNLAIQQPTTGQQQIR